MILLIDNYDSFVFNLARYFERLGQETHVVRNDAIDVSDVADSNPSAIVLSPGPCGPDEAGNSLEIVKSFAETVPMLGICLGHQTIAAAFGATIVRHSPVHGRTSSVAHTGHKMFDVVENPFDACRYHSLVVDAATLPPEVEVTATTDAEIVMAIAHRSLPVLGVQFHPESILTNPGFRILANFLRIAGLNTSDHDSLFEGELRPVQREPDELPDVPVTF